ncbi:hypothetical protein D3C85_981130 [compost metagenome]
MPHDPHLDILASRLVKLAPCPLPQQALLLWLHGECEQMRKSGESIQLDKFDEKYLIWIKEVGRY